MNTLIIISFFILVVWFVLYLTIGFNPFNLSSPRFQFRFSECFILSNYVVPQYSNDWGLTWVDIKTDVNKDVMDKIYYAEVDEISSLNLERMERVKAKYSTLEICRQTNRETEEKANRKNAEQDAKKALKQKLRYENLTKIAAKH